MKIKNRRHEEMKPSFEESEKSLENINFLLSVEEW